MARLDLRVYQGSRFELPVDVKENGAVKDLTGYTARMQIRPSKESAQVLADYSTANGAITINPATGRVTVVAASAVTDAYTWVAGVYDMEIVTSGGEATRILEGRVSLSRQVTR
jgi:hypothetical protein